jgi:hypothetical protein
MTALTMTGASSLTIHILPNGESVLSSADPLYRYLRALAELFIAGVIDADELSEHEHRWSTVYKPGDGYFVREIGCPAAKQLLGSIALALMEPSCICIANWDGPPCIRNCEPMDRRARLRALMGV